MARKTGLGKGLDALFQVAGDKPNDVVELKLSEIEPNHNQPRKEFDQQALESLADSIRQHGLIQPLIVRPQVNGGYQIVAGERRWRASRMAGLTQVPVMIREMGDQQTMEIALIENLQREDLNPIEEAKGYQELIDRYGFTQEQVAQSVGKSRPAVANALRLLGLPEPITAQVESGRLSAGQARAILSLGSEQQMIEVAQKAIEQGYTVRQLETLSKKKESPRSSHSSKTDSFYDEVQIALQQSLRRKVTIRRIKGEQGCLQIDFYSKQELEDLANLIAKERK